jgi:hypothetical protein
MSIRPHRYLAVLRRIKTEARTSTHTHYSEWVTVRDLSKMVRISQNAVVEIVEETPELDLIVALGCGNGVAGLGAKGDYLVEWIGEDV